MSGLKLALRAVIEITKANQSLPLPKANLYQFYNVGPATIQQLEQIGAVSPDPPLSKTVSDACELSVRAYERLSRAGLLDKSKARQAILSGQLSPAHYRTPDDPLRGYGKLTHIEVCNWVGLAIPIKPKIHCPHCQSQLDWGELQKQNRS